MKVYLLKYDELACKSGRGRNLIFGVYRDSEKAGRMMMRCARDKNAPYYSKRANWRVHEHKVQ